MNTRRNVAILVAVVLGGLTLVHAGQGGVGRRPVFTNDSVDVSRLLLLPSAAETPHMHPYPIIFVQLTPGDAQMLRADSTTKEKRGPGAVDFFARDVTHAIVNAGAEPFEVLTIAINPDRLRGGTAPPAAPPAGITRMPVVDNADTTVTRLEFAPWAREPVHMHPYDLVVVPLTSARVEVDLGGKKEGKTLTPGDAFFIARFEPHALANLGSDTLTVLGIVIK